MKIIKKNSFGKKKKMKNRRKIIEIEEDDSTDDHQIEPNNKNSPQNTVKSYFVRLEERIDQSNLLLEKKLNKQHEESNRRMEKSLEKALEENNRKLIEKMEFLQQLLLSQQHMISSQQKEIAMLSRGLTIEKKREFEENERNNKKNKKRKLDEEEEEEEEVEEEEGVEEEEEEEEQATMNEEEEEKMEEKENNQENRVESVSQMDLISPPKDSIKIFIRHVENNHSIELQISKELQVSKLLDLICEQKGFNRKNCQLFTKEGVELIEGQVEGYQIEDGSTLILHGGTINFSILIPNHGKHTVKAFPWQHILSLKKNIGRMMEIDCNNFKFINYEGEICYQTLKQSKIEDGDTINIVFSQMGD